MSEFKLDGKLWTKCDIVSSLGRVELPIHIVQEGDSPPTQRQLNVLYSFSNLPEAEIKDEIQKNAIKYCDYIDSIVDLEEEGIVVNKEKIENHFTIKSLLIPMISNCTSNLLFVSADCDWEAEHGMQLLFEDGKVIWYGEHTSLPFSPKWKAIVTESGAFRKEAINSLLL